jgi:aminopeptidase-like protein
MKIGDWVEVVGTRHKGATGFVFDWGWDTKTIYLTLNAQGEKISGFIEFDKHNLMPIPYSIHPDDLYTLTDIALFKKEKQWFDELRKKEMQP